MAGFASIQTMWRGCFYLLAGCVGTMFAESPLSPEAALAAWSLADPQLRIELVASEPDVRDPVAMTFDENGRIYVVEMNDYPLGPAGGHIKLLETDDRGRVTKSTVFADKLPYPTGICRWKGGVFVTAAPDVLYLKDTDGDGCADVREIVYSGFTTGNQQHRVNNLTFAFDGWIYGGNGASGGAIRRVINGKKTGKAVIINGFDFRFRPDLSAFEAVVGQSQFAQTFDAWGNRFVNENWNHIRHVPLPSRYFKRNPYVAAPAALEDIADHGATAQVFPISKIGPRFNDPHTAGHFTSACALTIYLGDALPVKYRGAAFTCEPVHNLVHLDLLEARGATFVGRRAWPDREFLASIDPWCRPVNFSIGPDGALYIVDFYRAVVEHPEWIYNRADTQLKPDEIKKVDLRAGDDRGRIWRVVDKDFRQPKPPRLGNATTRELIAHLSHPNLWWRLTAQRLLMERQPNEAIPLLRSAVKRGKSPLGRFHSLYILDGWRVLDDESLRVALQDREAGIREHAIRLCETNHGALILAASEKLSDDRDFRVRWQLALSLGQIQPAADATIARALAQIAGRDTNDKWMQFAVVNASSQNTLKLLALLKADGRFMETTPAITWARQLGSLIGARKNTAEIAGLLAQIAEPTPPLPRTEKSTLPTPRDGPTINITPYGDWQTEALAGLSESVRRSNSKIEDFLIDPKIAEHILEIFRIASGIASDAEKIEPLRQESIRLLAYAPFEIASSTLPAILHPQQSQVLQLAAIQSLAAHPKEEVAPILLSRWRSFSPQTRAAALDALLLRPERVAKLLDAIESGDVLASVLDAPRRDQLLRHPSRAIAQRAGKLFSVQMGGDRAKAVEAYRPSLALRGDATRGHAVYTKVCAACHRLGDIGHAVGPDLTAIRSRAPDQLLVDILDPNRAVEPNYQQYAVTTTNGDTITGIITSETTSSLTLRGAEAKETSILRQNIESIAASRVSLMPEGLENGLTQQDFADLLAAVTKTTSVRAKLDIIRPGADGRLLLLATNCEMYGTSLILEEKYRNLGYWQSRDDHAVWTIDVPRVGDYLVEFDYACANDTANNEFVIESNGNYLSAKVEGTGTWDDYRKKQMGTITLAGGTHQLVMRPTNRLRGPLIDLRSIVLTPAKKQ